MKDRSVQYPARYQFTPVTGTTDTYDLAPVPGTVAEAGDDINTGNLLPDETAQLTGAYAEEPTNPQVKHALQAVATKVGGIKISVETDLGDNYALCNGASYKTADYPALAAVDPNDAVWSYTSSVSMSNLTYGNGYYVYRGTNGYLYYATNVEGPYTQGILWYTGGDAYYVFSLCFVNGYFAGFRYNPSTGYVYLKYSTSPVTGGSVTTMSAFTGFSTEVGHQIFYDGTYYWTYGFGNSSCRLVHTTNIASWSSYVTMAATDVREFAISDTHIAVLVGHSTLGLRLYYNTLAGALTSMTYYVLDATQYTIAPYGGVTYLTDISTWVVPYTDAAYNLRIRYTTDFVNWNVSTVKTAYGGLVDVWGQFNRFGDYYYFTVGDTAAPYQLHVYYAEDVTGTWTDLLLYDNDNSHNYYRYPLLGLNYPQIIVDVNGTDFLYMPTSGNTVGYYYTSSIVGDIKHLPTIDIESVYAYIRLE